MDDTPPINDRDTDTITINRGDLKDFVHSRYRWIGAHFPPEEFAELHSGREDSTFSSKEEAWGYATARVSAEQTVLNQLQQHLGINPKELARERSQDLDDNLFDQEPFASTYDPEDPDTEGTDPDTE